MKNSYKTILILVCIQISLSFSAIPSFAASASGQWQINKSTGQWWYRHADGSYSSKSWEMISGKWYYFDAAGWMSFGWQNINNQWYYLGTRNDGAMKTGWQSIAGKWYYFDHNGGMKTGWITLDSGTYYLGSKEDGSMKTGWQKIEGEWYFFGNTGALKRDYWTGGYYLDTEGKMLREPGLTLKKSVIEIQVHGYEGVPSNPTYDKTITDSIQINRIMSFLKLLQAADPDYIYTERSGSTVCNLTIVYEDNTEEKMTVTDEELWCEGRWYNPLKIDDLIDLL